MTDAHGTYGTYQREMRYHGKACDACRAAATKYVREWRKGKGAEKQSRLERIAQVRDAAMRELARRHPDELLAIMKGDA